MWTSPVQQFEFFFTSDLAEATGLQRSRFKISNLVAGSIKVGLVIESEEEGDDDVHGMQVCMRVARNLQEQVENPKSVLRAGQITRFATHFDIESPPPEAEQPRADEAPNALIMLVAKIEEMMSAEQDARIKAEKIHGTSLILQEQVENPRLGVARRALIGLPSNWRLLSMLAGCSALFGALQSGCQAIGI